MEMLQTVVILIGKYQLKDDISCVVFQQVFYTTTTIAAGINLRRISLFFFMDDLISWYRNFNQILEVKNLDLWLRFYGKDKLATSGSIKMPIISL